MKEKNPGQSRAEEERTTTAADRVHDDVETRLVHRVERRERLVPQDVGRAEGATVPLAIDDLGGAVRDEPEVVLRPQVMCELERERSDAFVRVQDQDLCFLKSVSAFLFEGKKKGDGPWTRAVRTHRAPP